MLAISPFFYGGHQDVFCSEMGDVLLEVVKSNFGLRRERGEEMVEEIEEGVSSEEGFGEGESSIRRVVEGAFEPLGRCSVGRVLRK